MTEEERAVITVELRLRGAHPSWIEYWLAAFPASLINLYRSDWKYPSGSEWTPAWNHKEQRP